MGLNLGYIKHADRKHRNRDPDGSANESFRFLKYRPPLIFSAKFGEPLVDANKSKFSGTEYGTFEVKAAGDGLKAYALLWIHNDPSLVGIDSIHHRDVCRILKKMLHMHREFGRVVLGGGFIAADYDAHTISIFGQSGDYGRVPDFMRQGLFRCRGYLVSTRGIPSNSGRPGESNLLPATEWYLSHGIDVE